MTIRSWIIGSQDKALGLWITSQSLHITWHNEVGGPIRNFLLATKTRIVCTGSVVDRLAKGSFHFRKFCSLECNHATDHPRVCSITVLVACDWYCPFTGASSSLTAFNARTYLSKLNVKWTDMESVTTRNRLPSWQLSHSLRLIKSLKKNCYPCNR
jgi:hypothetical protein